MRKKRFLVICIISVIFVAMLLFAKLETVWKWTQVEAPVIGRVLGLTVVEDLSFLEEKKLRESESNPGVLFENTLLPYDVKSNTLFLSQSADTTEWVGELSAENNEYYLCTTQDVYWQKKQEAINEGHSYWIWLVAEDHYYKMKLVISGMPTISIDTDFKEKIQNEEELLGTISVFNPDIGCDRYEIHQSYVTYHIKGNTSRKFEKKSYSLKLQDYKGQKLDASLLGMRYDNSWKLNALYTDSNRIREKTAADLWEKFSEAHPQMHQDGPRLEYVELIINNEYEGVYCLVEPVDEDKLELDKNDVLYKVVGWQVPSYDDFVTAAAQKANTVATIRINYPKIITDYEAVWYPMQDYNERFYLSPEFEYEQALSTVNVTNLSDVFMFLMVTSASDNHYKNMYYAAEVTGENEYVMKQIPWDLDYTFGNIHSGETVSMSQFNEDYKGIYAEVTLPRLKFANLEEIGYQFLEQWEEYRSSFLSTESVLQLLQENRDYLSETGALQRESERWPENPVNEDIEQLLQYQEARMLWLDTYFTEWSMTGK